MVWELSGVKNCVKTPGRSAHLGEKSGLSGQLVLQKPIGCQERKTPWTSMAAGT